jgi:hypothetical protein
MAALPDEKDSLKINKLGRSRPRRVRPNRGRKGSKESAAALQSKIIGCFVSESRSTSSPQCEIGPSFRQKACDPGSVLHSAAARITWATGRAGDPATAARLQVRSQSTRDQRLHAPAHGCERTRFTGSRSPPASRTIVIGSGGRGSCELCHLNSPKVLRSTKDTRPWAPLALIGSSHKRT